MANVGNEPQNCPDIEDDSRPDQSLLDHFAGLAMQGVLSNSRGLYGPGYPNENKSLAMCSYAIATAMLAERKYLMEQP